MAGRATLTLLMCGLVSTVLSHSLTEQQCSSPVTVTIDSRRNQTGQWTTQIGLEHSKKTGPWFVKTDICNGDETVRIFTTISAQSTTVGPSGYDLFPGIGFYKFHPNGTTWPRARQICAEEGTHLAIINSEKEADVMSQLFARFPKSKINAGDNSDWAWVGVHEMGVNGEYYTIFGEPLNSTGFMRWVNGQPDDVAVDTAVVTNRHSGGLGDAYPAWTASFICEKELQT